MKGFLWLTSQRLHGIYELMLIESQDFEKRYYLNTKQNYLISSVSYVASSFDNLVMFNLWSLNMQLSKSSGYTT